MMKAAYYFFFIIVVLTAAVVSALVVLSEEFSAGGKEGYPIEAKLKVYINNKEVNLSELDSQFRAGYFWDMGREAISIYEPGITIGEFLNTVDVGFNATCIGIPEMRQYCQACNRPFRFYVNGMPNDRFDKYALKNSDRILISYGYGDVDKQLESMNIFTLEG